jgi:hypothetical protein
MLTQSSSSVDKVKIVGDQPVLLRDATRSQSGIVRF